VVENNGMVTLGFADRNANFAGCLQAFPGFAVAPYWSASPTQGLSMAIDTTDIGMGPALFFLSPFDKLVIVRECIVWDNNQLVERRKKEQSRAHANISGINSHTKRLQESEADCRSRRQAVVLLVE
jgi:hypothetical protein